jgi:DNA-binding NtrC family response regulator
MASVAVRVLVVDDEAGARTALMPKMSGMQLIKELHDRHRELPVIVVTSAAELRPAVDAMRAGAIDYITKPVDFDELLLAISRAIEQRDVRLENENLRRQIREKHGEGASKACSARAP